MGFTQTKTYSTRIFQAFMKTGQLWLAFQISLTCKTNQRIDISFCFGKDSQVVSALFTVISSSCSLAYISWEWLLSDYLNKSLQLFLKSLGKFCIASLEYSAAAAWSQNNRKSRKKCFRKSYWRLKM